MAAGRQVETAKENIAIIVAAILTLFTHGLFRADAVQAAQTRTQQDCRNWNTEEFFKNATAAVVKHCLDMGADVNARDGDEATPLHLASQFGTPGQIKVLVEAGADIQAMAYAWESGGAYEGRSDWTPLHVAAVLGTPANVKALIDTGANPTRDVLEWAAARGTPANLKALVDAGVDLDGGLHAAIYGDPDNASVLLEAGADIGARDRNGWTPLHLAASWDGDGDRVQALVAAGAELEAQGQRGWTPLHLAASMRYDGLSSGNPAALAALLRLGANTEALDDEGQTPLHLAALHPEAEWGQPGSETKIGVLLAAGADIEARNGRGRTPLHLAAGIEHGGRESDYLSILLEAGASVEAKDEDGQTPLDRAAGVATDASGRSDTVVKLLLAPVLFVATGTGGDSAVTTSTGWRVVVANGMGAATRSGRTVVLFADEEETQEDQPEPKGSWHRILSAVGSIVSIENSYYYEGGAHPSYGTIWKTVDLEAGESGNLAAIFPEDEILAALRADRIVREAYRGGEEPGSLFELIDNLDGGCDMRFSRDMLADYAFHHVREDRVAVRIGLTHGCEVMRGSFTQLGVYLDIPPVLSEALDRANVNGWLMETRENR